MRDFIGNTSVQFPEYRTMGILFVYLGKINSIGIYITDHDSIIRAVNSASSNITVTCTNKIVTFTNNVVNAVQHALFIYV